MRGPLSYLNKLTRIPKTDVCFPMGFDRHEFSRVQLTKSDIKPVDAIYKLILPQRHLGQVSKKKTLDPDAEKIVNEIIEKKTKELSKKKKKKIQQETDESDSINESSDGDVDDEVNDEDDEKTEPPIKKQAKLSDYFKK